MQEIINRLEEVAASYSLDLPGLFRRVGILHIDLTDRVPDLRIKTLVRIMEFFPDVNINYIVSGKGPMKFDDYEFRNNLNKHVMSLQEDVKTWKQRYYDLQSQFVDQKNSP